MHQYIIFSLTWEYKYQAILRLSKKVLRDGDEDEARVALLFTCPFLSAVMGEIPHDKVRRLVNHSLCLNYFNGTVFYTVSCLEVSVLGQSSCLKSFGHVVHWSVGAGRTTFGKRHAWPSKKH